MDPHLYRMHVQILTVTREDDTKWPQKNKDGRQELEIRLGGEHISFEVSTAQAIKEATILILIDDRRPKLDPWLMSTSRKIQRDFAYSTTWYKI